MGDDEYDAYIKDISRIPLLDASETKRLAELSFKGDIHARNKLVESNLRFVALIASRYKGKGLPLADLLSEGSIGLITAAERYDPDTENSFLTYAKHWIHQTIARALKDKARLIRVPTNRMEKFFRVMKCKQAIETISDNKAAEAEISTMSGLQIDEVRQCLALLDDASSLDAPIDGMKGKTLVDTIKSDSPGPEECCENEDLKSRIKLAVFTLPDREKKMIVRRYGLDGFRPQERREISCLQGVSVERVRQIENVSLERLRGMADVRALSVYMA